MLFVIVWVCQAGAVTFFQPYTTQSLGGGAAGGPVIHVADVLNWHVSVQVVAEATQRPITVHHVPSTGPAGVFTFGPADDSGAPSPVHLVLMNTTPKHGRAVFKTLRPVALSGAQVLCTIVPSA